MTKPTNCLYFMQYLLIIFLAQNCNGFPQLARLQAHRQSSTLNGLSSQSPFSGYYKSRALISLNFSPEEQNESFEPKRPEWALDWMPTWLITMRPIYQLLTALCFYIFHLKVLTQKFIAFPFQVFPNRLGHFQGLGLDSLAGILTLVGYLLLRRSTKDKDHPAVPSLLSTPKESEAPWKIPKIPQSIPEATTKWKIPKFEQFSNLFTPKSTVLITFFYLLKSWRVYVPMCSFFWEDYLINLTGLGFQITDPMRRSLGVLLGHLSWIAIGGAIFSFFPRPQPFFGGGLTTKREHMEQDDDDDSSRISIPKKQRKILQKFRWYTNQWNTYWLWWTVGGYFVSTWFFNLADFCNQMLLPHSVFEADPESVVADLLKPENNDLLAGFVGGIAPCVTAPWWEEILFRGFTLPALCLFFPYWLSVWISGILFSLNHMSAGYATGAIPLMVLGWIWPIIYTKCGNLIVTILIHAMWNSRVFIGNYIGL